jgi:hypothetical protein
MKRFFSHWFAGKSKQARKSNRPQSVKPTLEALEDRLLMTAGLGIEPYLYSQGPDGTWAQNIPYKGHLIIDLGKATARDNYVGVKTVSGSGGDYVEVDFAPWHFDQAHPQGFVTKSELQKRFFSDNLVLDVYFFGNHYGRNYFRNDTNDPTWAWGAGFQSPAKGSPNNVLIGGFSENHLFGGGGDDLLVARTTQPTGGFTLLEPGVWHAEFEDQHAFEQHLFFGVDNAWLAKHHFQNELYAAGGNATLIGSSFDNYLSGGTSNAKIYGGQHHDFIFGGSGNDYIDPGPGNKSVWGGTGAVTFVDYRGVDRRASLPDDFDPNKGDILIPVQTGAGTFPDINPILAGPVLLAGMQSMNVGDQLGDPGQNNLIAPDVNFAFADVSRVGVVAGMSTQPIDAAADIIDTGAEIQAIVTAQLQAVHTPTNLPVLSQIDQVSDSLGGQDVPGEPVFDPSMLAILQTDSVANTVDTVDPPVVDPTRMVTSPNLPVVPDIGNPNPLVDISMPLVQISADAVNPPLEEAAVLQPASANTPVAPATELAATPALVSDPALVAAPVPGTAPVVDTVAAAIAQPTLVNNVALSPVLSLNAVDTFFSSPPWRAF